MNIRTLIIGHIIFFSNAASAYTAIGILQGKGDITLTTRSQGEISVIHHKDGSIIRAGTIIAQLENEKELIEKNLAENEYETAKNDYDKSLDLKKYISEDELNKKKNIYLSKKSNLDLKNYNLKTRYIVSPISGVVARSYIKKGEYVSSGNKAFDIVQPENLIIDLHVDAAVIKKIKEGDKLPFKSELHSQSYQAVVTYIGPILDKASGTVNVKLKLNNPLTANKYLFHTGEMVKIQFD
jgi:RND family efflux transporter MFP subunit